MACVAPSFHKCKGRTPGRWVNSLESMFKDSQPSAGRVKKPSASRNCGPEFRSARAKYATSSFEVVAGCESRFDIGPNDRGVQAILDFSSGRTSEIQIRACAPSLTTKQGGRERSCAAPRALLERRAARIAARHAYAPQRGLEIHTRENVPCIRNGHQPTEHAMGSALNPLMACRTCTYTFAVRFRTRISCVFGRSCGTGRHMQKSSALLLAPSLLACTRMPIRSAFIARI